MKPASLMDATDATEAKEKGCFRNFPLLSFTFCFSLLLSVLAVPAFSQVPGVTHYQGSLRDKSGNPINASLPMTLSIYDTPTVGTGTQLWTENQTVGVSNGVFSISVGAVNPIPESVFASSSTYLEVDINGETPSAREQLLSGAYSFHSSVADYALTVSPEIAVSTIDATASTPFGGVNITTSVFVQGSVGISSVLTSGNLFTVGAGTLTVTQSGNVGIGTGSPQATLNVAGSVIGAGWQNYTKITASGNFTVPQGVYKIMAWLIGGGGGAGETASGYTPGGSGGGGCFDILIATVTPGAVYPVTIGSGGAGATSASVNGNNGGATTFLGDSAGGGEGGGGSGNNSSGGGGGICSGNGLFFQGANGLVGESPYGETGACSGGFCSGQGGGSGGPGGSAPNNSGGGGGAGAGGQPGGSGGSGYIVIWW